MPLGTMLTDSIVQPAELGNFVYPPKTAINSEEQTEGSVLGCTQSEEQIVYSSEYDNPIVTIKIPYIKRKFVRLFTTNPQGDTSQINLSTKDISIILDQEAEMPGFLVFDEKGNSFCSTEEGLLDFPDHFSYRCLTKDRKIITAGVLKSQPVVAHEPVRKLVNDNINKEDIDVVLSDNVVIECYKTSSWIGATYTINVNVTSLELAYYKEDIIKMIKNGYAKMDNAEDLQASTNTEDASRQVENTNEETASENESETEENDEEELALNSTGDEKESENKNAEKSSGNENAASSESKTETARQPKETVEKAASIEEDDQPANLGTRDVPNKPEDSIAPEELDEIQREAEDKLYRLQDCFVMLVNRNYSAEQKKRERETTIQDLFINERANVGVSSVNSETIDNYLIGKYLLRLERMISAAYQKVEIVFSEIYKVSNFKRNPDGSWSATVTFSQEFKGFSDVEGQEVSYSDITQKSVTVKIRRVELFTGESTPEVYWEVLLADIGVNQTTPFK
jgi:hypothetical protein